MKRRTFLRGLGGIAIALPWLELNASGFSKKNNTRLAWVYMPNGYLPDKFTPVKTGNDYEITECLKPLSDLKNDFNIYSGLALSAGHGSGHTNCCAFLTDAGRQSGENPRLVANFSENKNNVKSIDQVAAEYLGDNSFIESMNFTSQQSARYFIGKSSQQSARYFIGKSNNM